MQFSRMHDALTKPNGFCGRNASKCHHLTFHISIKSHQAFARYEPSKYSRVSSFYSSFYQGVKVGIKHKRIIQMP